MSILVDEEEPLVDVEDAPFEPRDVKVRREDVEAEFDIYDFLGRGKFGEVKRCVEKVSGKEFAAKFIVAPGPQDKSEVEQEVEIMKKLQHKRLLQLYDCFCSKTEMCLVLEIILGGELFDRVIDDDFILTERACVIFMRQICEGVDYMHSRNIIHLDMKPENILCLSRTGNRIKIIDFGLAREYNPKKDLRVLFGTPEFMAPEVVQYEPIAFATDMWSVGVICYVLLSGLSPFMGDNDGETLVNVIKGGYDFCYAEFSEVTEPAKDLIRKLLVKDKTKRLTAKECLQHPWLKREEPKRTASQLDLSKRRLKRFVYRRKWQKIVNAIIALKRMGVRLKSLRNRRTMSGAFKKQESIFGWDAKKGAPSNVKNGMKTPEVMDRTSDMTPDVTSEISKPDIVSAVDNVTDDIDTAGTASTVDDIDTDSNAGVSVTATFVLSTDFTDNTTTQQAEATCSVATVEAEQSISLDDTVSHVSVEAELVTVEDQDSDALVPKSEQAVKIESSNKGSDTAKKPNDTCADKKPKDTCDDQKAKDSQSQKGKRKGKDKQKAKEKEVDTEKSKEKEVDTKKSKVKEVDTEKSKVKEVDTEKSKIKEKGADKGKTKDKEKEKSKSKSKDKDKEADKGKGPWCRPGRPEPGTLRHVPISERTKPVPKRQEAPWSKQKIRRQDGIHLHTLKDWREVKTGNPKVSRDIPAESTMSTIETSATDSPDRDQAVTDTLLTVDTASGSRSRKTSETRKNSDGRKISDPTAPEAPATMRVCRKSNKIEIENGRPKSQNLDNLDVMAEYGNGVGADGKSAEKGKENGGLVEMKAYGRSKSDQPMGTGKNRTKKSTEKREMQPLIKVHEPTAIDNSATHSYTGWSNKSFVKYKHNLEADATKEEPPDSHKTTSQTPTKAYEKPGLKVDTNKELEKSNANVEKPTSAVVALPNADKQKTVGVKPALKLDTKIEPRFDQDNTKPKTPDTTKSAAPNFKKAFKHNKSDKSTNRNSNPLKSEQTDHKSKPSTERDSRSRSPVRPEPVFRWQQPGVRKMSLPPEDKVPHSKPSNEVKTSGMLSTRGKFTSEENLSSNHTKSLIQNSPWTRSQSMQDGDGYRSHNFKGTPVIFPGIQEVPQQQDKGNPHVVAGHNNIKGSALSKSSSLSSGTVADMSAEAPLFVNASNKSTLDNNSGLGTTCQSLVHSGFATLPRKRPGVRSIKPVVVKTLSDTLESPSSEEPKDVNGAGSVVVEGDGGSEDQEEVKILSIRDRIRLLKTQNEEKDPGPKVQFHYGPDDDEEQTK